MLSFFVTKLIETIKISRSINCLMALVGVLIGAYLTGDKPSYFFPFLASLSAFFTCAAGNIVNDLLDIEADRVNHPNRVLVQGTVSPKYALFMAIFFNLIAIGISLFTSPEVIIMVFSAIILLLLYNFFLKKIVLIGNVVIGILGAMTFLTGGVAVDINQAFELPGPIIPAVFSFLFHFIREMIKDVEDIKGDRQVQIKTIPQIVGVRMTLWLAMLLFLILFVLTIVPVWKGWFGTVYEIITIYIIDIPLLIVLTLLLWQPDEKRLRIGSLSLKLGMAMGIIALLAA